MSSRRLPALLLTLLVPVALSTCTGGDETGPSEAPTVTSVTPTSGPTTGGTVVTVTGTNFPNSATVTFGSVPAAAVVIESATQARVTTPAHAPGLVDVTVTAPDGQSATRPGAFTFVSPPPTVASVSPARGLMSGGTRITITGTGFQSGATATVGGADAASVFFVSSTSLEATTPAGSPGAVAVAVRNPDGQSASLAGGFTYLALPSISSVSPASGPVAGGTTITITGVGFTAGSTVTIDGRAATNVLVGSPTSLTAVTPAGSAGSVSVVVATPEGGAATATGAFTYVSPPAVAFVSPEAGPPAGGTIVTISGSSFQSGATVRFGSNAATNVTFVSSTQLQATTPSGPPGPVAVTVTNPDGQSGSLAAGASGGFRYFTAPVVASVTPGSGNVSGGTTITISGSGFQNGATVMVGDSAAKVSDGSAQAPSAVVFVSSSTLTAVTPGGTPGAKTVTVINPDGQSGSLAGAFTYVQPPTVTSVSPGSGSVDGGTSITIAGTGFQSGAQVSIGGKAASSVVVSSATSIQAVTPAGSLGPVAVTVTNPDGGSATLAGGFTYVGPPTLSAVTPAGGPPAGGTRVRISGTGFRAGATVVFGLTPATEVEVSSETLILATTPPGSPGPVAVTVANPDGQSATLPPGFAGGFAYFTPPTVLSLSPPSGSTNGGTTVTVTGRGFQVGASVLFNGVPATNVQVSSGTTLTAVTPAGPAGPATVTVRNADGESGTLQGGFTYVSFFSVASVSPQVGDVAGGTLVTISGSGFQSGASVTFGATPATGVTFVSSTTLTALTPAQAAGSVGVTVANPGAPASTLANAFTYTVFPTVTSVSPALGPVVGGTAITVTGTAFQAGATVTVGGAPATAVTFVSSTSLTATTPAGAAGPANVGVANPDGGSASLASAFTFIPPPTVTGVSPAFGPTAGGTAVTITGTGFQGGATVTIGGAAATGVTVVSATSITATTPAHALGAASVVVNNPDGQSGTLPSGFTFVPPPTITAVSPSSGYTSGGTLITITGTGFQAGAAVSVGGTAATGVTVVSATSITATTPAHAAGAVTVQVTNVDGQSGSLASAFTFVPPPTVTSVSPTSGRTSGGTAITITGTNFVAGATVTVGGTAATGVTVVSATSITATTPAHAAGVGAIVVTNPDGQTGTLASAFTFVPPPTVISVTPTSGRTSGGTAITITGTGFLAGAAVTVGGTAATGVTVVSATSITATTAAHAAGVGAIVVTNPDGQTGTLASAFTFIPPPVVTAINPNFDVTSGGKTVTITGSAFIAGAAVTIGGVAATGVTFVSSTSLTAVVPPHASGVVDVVVTNPDGQTGTLVGGFTYSALAITSLSRDAGSTAGGATVIVNGSGFVSAETPVVSFGATTAATTFISSTQLSVVTPAHGAGQVDVTVNQGAASFTLTGKLPNGGKAFEFIPAPTTTYVSHGFEDGTVGPFTTEVFPAAATLAVGNWGAGFAHSGTQAVRATVPGGSNSGARLVHLYSPRQPANEPNGVCQRWYIRTDAQTLSTLTTSPLGQIKLLLNRSGTNPPSWLHLGVGKEFTSPAPNNITVFTDYNTGFVAATPLVPQTRTGYTITADTWVELQTCYLRSGGTGRARLWIDGKLKFDHTDVNFGTDDLVSKTMSWGFGLEYSQNTPAGVTLTMYTDDARAANGFIDP